MKKSGLKEVTSGAIEKCTDKEDFCNDIQPDCKLAKSREQCARYCGVCTTGIGISSVFKLMSNIVYNMLERFLKSLIKMD